MCDAGASRLPLARLFRRSHSPVPACLPPVRSSFLVLATSHASGDTVRLPFEFDALHNGIKKLQIAMSLFGIPICNKLALFLFEITETYAGQRVSTFCRL